MSEIRTTLFKDPSKDTRMASASQGGGPLRGPKAQRAEIEQLRDQLQQVRDYKEQQRFLGRRERVMQKGWRHGVVGVDDADSEQTQVFY